ncbi:MAG TPA: cation-translocating P-type ATPase [Verrucomicrobiales bacterium]|nr:cation-translocating P-type ATPase [Verrucomicrobiales bacterium]HIL70777.1 cation-translocating P-type ATPase [Verrucomicrobiota bacterium]
MKKDSPTMLKEREKIELRVSGMTCSNCARHVREAITGLPGVVESFVDLKQEKVTVCLKSEGIPGIPELRQVIQKAGFRLEKVLEKGEELDRPSSSWFSGWTFNLILGGVCTVPMMIMEWGGHLGMERWYQWTSFLLALPVQTVCGARFYIGAWNQARNGQSNMDTLVSLGSTTAFAYSLWALLNGWETHLFFMESASIITLISVGHALESRVAARAETAIQSLLNLVPPTARLIESDGKDREIPAGDLQIDDTILLKPGDQVPCDGIVLEGSSLIDESMLTGESMPVSKTKDHEVFAGTVNQDGRLLVNVTATESGTSLSRIVEYVMRAQNSRASIQKLGDRVSSIFVPIVVLIAVLAGIWWGIFPETAQALRESLQPWLWKSYQPEGALASAVFHIASVLIVACPCAMGLATPIAIMAGTNAAALKGILIRDGAALEKSGTINTVVFDKTGTLTEGCPKVSDCLIMGNDLLVEQQVHQLVSSLAQPSNHPLSRALCKFSDPVVTLDEWKEFRGLGIQAELKASSGFPVEGRLMLGSMAWHEEQGVPMQDSRIREYLEPLKEKGVMLSILSLNLRVLAIYVIEDQLKKDADLIIKMLSKQKKRIYLLTGDRAEVALSLGKSIGLSEDRILAGIKPEGKADAIRKLQAAGDSVAFVGDGINDAPALQQADLGIAVSQAGDIAKEAADIVLLNSDIHSIPEAIRLSQATLRTIKQNLFWAFFYNVCAIPLAFLGFLSPILCALAMGLSDIVVIGNALKLRYYSGN